ncbi:3489_t:CDS:10 [Diversispora eburnea]|uniref:3489_t:CDS:1 n=1 Tax=Diversispora eburnea TaxID=1213867 RepID=A0A9N9FE23_9GLOM|nr:3489_t:CDS:10 [Diversispora eburnea]
METTPTKTEATPLSDAERQANTSNSNTNNNNNSVETSTTASMPSRSEESSNNSKVMNSKKTKQLSVQEKENEKMKIVVERDWQNEAISKVLGITLNVIAQRSGNKLVYLDSVVKELKEENPEMTIFKFNKSNLDNSLVARLSLDPNQMRDEDEDVIVPQIPSFDYLLDCWKRAVEIKRNLLTRLIINYSGLVIQYPDMFPQVNNTSIEYGPQQLVQRLLVDIDTPEGLPWDFVQELAEKVEEEEFEGMFGPSLIALSAQMRSKDILTGDYLHPLNLPKMPSWNPPNLPPRAFEQASLLGPFCRVSVFPMDEPSVAESYFSNVQQRRQSDIESEMSSLRAAIQGVQNSLFTIFNNIIRSSPSAREAVLDFWATVIKLNQKRAQMHVDPLQVGTDGFIVNLTRLLLSFAEPFMDYTYSKIDRIDIDYFRKSKRIDISQETKIKANQQESDEYYNSVDSKPKPNFISEIFFLTISMHHYGPLHCYEKYNNFLRDLSELQKQYDRMKEDQPNWLGTPNARVNEELLKRCKVQLDKGASHKVAYDSQLLDPAALSYSLRFYNLVMNWILRIVDPSGKHPSTRIRYNPRIANTVSRDELLIFIITFLSSSAYVKNPYLKAKFVEILFHFTIRNENEGGMGVILATHPIALNHLMPSLMSFYVEVEQTGAHTQFYDKFNIRYNISQIFKSIWDNRTHRERLKEESRKTESFVRFANLLMNDATYLLDESLSKLTDIHNIQNEMDNKEQWEKETPNYRQEREGLLRSYERQATSYMALGNETVHMLEYMTSEVVEPFLTPEIVERLAAMMDYNLVSLVGPKCTELKVKNPEKYRFQPRELLSQLINIYLNLCDRKEFIQAVARDGRSYHKDHFSKAAGILLKKNLKSEKDVEKLKEFVDNVEEVVKNEAAKEEELDPLMFEIMEDPVILPESKVSIDRSTITTHLLCDAMDPFNRKPLTIDQERIAAYRKERQKKKK